MRIRILWTLQFALAKMSYNSNSSFHTPTGKIQLPHKLWRQLTSGQVQEYLNTQKARTEGKPLIVARKYFHLEQLVRHHKCLLPKPKEDWRLVLKPVSGHINGLEESMFGIAVATNGIMVAIEDPIADILFYGHLEWFIKDTTEESDLDVIITAKVKKPKKFDEDFEDYVA